MPLVERSHPDERVQLVEYNQNIIVTPGSFRELDPIPFEEIAGSDDYFKESTVEEKIP